MNRTITALLLVLASFSSAFAQKEKIEDVKEAVGNAVGNAKESIGNLFKGKGGITIVAIPAEATIKVNGSYYGEGSAIVKIKKNDFISLEVSCPGYETLTTRVYGNDGRKTIEIKLKEDKLLQQTAQSAVANNFFTVKVKKSLYKVAADGTRDTSEAWKLAGNILSQYFEEIMISDQTSGFIQTPWLYKNYIDSGKTLRSRVTVKESNIGGDLTFQIKLSSEMAPIQARSNDESFLETDRLQKNLESLISEFQTRLGQ